MGFDPYGDLVGPYEPCANNGSGSASPNRPAAGGHSPSAHNPTDSKVEEDNDSTQLSHQFPLVPFLGLKESSGNQLTKQWSSQVPGVQIGPSSTTLNYTEERWERYYRHLAGELVALNYLARKGASAYTAISRFEKNRAAFEALLDCWGKQGLTGPRAKGMVELSRILAGNTMHVLEPVVPAQSLLKFHEGLSHCLSEESILRNETMLYVQSKNDYLRQCFRSDMMGDQLKSATAEAQSLLIVAESALGKGSPVTTLVLITLSSLQYKCEMFSESLAGFSQALVSLATQGDDSGWWKAYVIMRIAAGLAGEGKGDEALGKTQESLALFRTWYDGSDHPVVADALQSKALLLKLKKKLFDALQTFSDCLEIRKRMFGETHPTVAQALYHIGVVHWCKYNYDGAYTALKTALAIRKEIYGEENVDVAACYHTLGSVLSDWNRVVESQESYQKALAIRRKVLGNKNADVAQSLNNLAALYTRLMKYDDAVRTHEEALSIRRKLYPNDHVETAQSIYNIAIVFKTNRKYEEALTRFEECLDMYKRLSKNVDADQQIGK